jgi:hypothetical protein
MTKLEPTERFCTCCSGCNYPYACRVCHPGECLCDCRYKQDGSLIRNPRPPEPVPFS